MLKSSTRGQKSIVSFGSIKRSPGFTKSSKRDIVVDSPTDIKEEDKGKEAEEVPEEVTEELPEAGEPIESQDLNSEEEFDFVSVVDEHFETTQGLIKEVLDAIVKNGKILEQILEIFHSKKRRV